MSNTNDLRHRIHRTVAARVLLVVLAGGCASASTSKVRIDTPANPTVLGFDRVLVAGFVPDGDQIDLNQETARFLRGELRSKTSLVIIESEPLQLTGVARAGGRAAQSFSAALQSSSRDWPRDSDPQEDDAVFTNVSFWKTLGEEYSEPLILTGIVRFSPAGPRMVERQMGRRTMRFWMRGFNLRLRLVLISGRNRRDCRLGTPEATDRARDDRSRGRTLAVFQVDGPNDAVCSRGTWAADESRSGASEVVNLGCYVGGTYGRDTIASQRWSSRRRTDSHAWRHVGYVDLLHRAAVVPARELFLEVNGGSQSTPSPT